MHVKVLHCRQLRSGRELFVRNLGQVYYAFAFGYCYYIQLCCVEIVGE